jgi:Ca2+/Na+ antiporter
MGLSILALTLIIVSDLLSATMSGLLIIAYLLALVFLLILLKNFRKLKDNIKRHTFGTIFISVALTGFLLIAYKPVFSHLNHYYQDVKIGFNIDEVDEWRILHGEGFQPLNSFGKPVTLNIYYRAAFAAKGIQLINKYPMGYGSINESFNRLQNLEGELHLHAGQVHSGWIDLGLAFGIPGLALIFIALVGALYSAIFLKTREGMLALFLCITLIPFGLVSELTYKQYFEMLIFLITFSCGLVYAQSYDSKSSHNFS